MISAVKAELYRLSLGAAVLETAESAAFRSGVLTGLSRSLELWSAEEQLAGIDPASSSESEATEEYG